MPRVEQGSMIDPVAARGAVGAPRVDWSAVPWARLWWLLVVLLILTLTGRDLRRIGSGVAYLMAERLHQSQRTHTAIDLLGYGKALSPTLPELYNKEGILLAASPSRRGSYTQFAYAVTIDESYGPALNNLAFVSSAQGQLDEAVKWQQKAVDSAPNQAQARYNLGVLLAEQGEWVAAARALREATRIDALWAPPYVQLGTALLAVENWEGAEQAAQRALQVAPHDPVAHRVLIIALFQQGKLAALHRAIAVALQQFPDDETIAFYRALTLQQAGETAAAVELFRTIFFATDDHQLLARTAQEILPLLNQLGAQQP